jgi:hypothetical protein
VRASDVRTRTCFIFCAAVNYGPQLLLSSKAIADPGADVVRLIIAVVVGAVIALGGTVLVTNVLSNQADGTPTPASSSLYNYGTR